MPINHLTESSKCHCFISEPVFMPVTYIYIYIYIYIYNIYIYIYIYINWLQMKAPPEDSENEMISYLKVKVKIVKEKMQCFVK